MTVNFFPFKQINLINNYTILNTKLDQKKCLIKNLGKKVYEIPIPNSGDPNCHQKKVKQ